MEIIQTLLIIGIVALAIFLYFKFFKIPKIKNIVFIDGSLGTGKSFYSVALAIRLYKKQVRLYYIKKTFLKCLKTINKKKFENKYNTLEKPLLYSNIKLRNIEHIVVTNDLLSRREYRFAYKSVLLLDEFSLIADQQMYKDNDLNESLSAFFKLFRHETRGGFCIINSQSTSDLHYSVKYVLSDYFYIHHKSRFPFFSMLAVEECKYSADKSSLQISTSDVEKELKHIIVLNKYFKAYDTYCYSVFTDNLHVYNKSMFFDKKASLKSDTLVSFKKGKK